MKTKFYTTFWLVSFALIIVSISATSLYGFRFEETRKKNFAMEVQGSLRLNGLRGDIEIRTHDGNVVKVSAIVMSDSDEEIKKAVIIFDHKGNQLLISEDYKTLPAGVNVEYFIKVPRGLRLVSVSSQTGKLKSRGKYGEIKFYTGTGEIDFKGSFSAAILESANGNIDINVKSALSGDLTARNSNGSITIEVNPQSHFTIDAQTVTGGIRSDFRTEISSDDEGAAMKGVINNGTYNIKLKSTNGNIAVVKK